MRFLHTTVFLLALLLGLQAGYAQDTKITGVVTFKADAQRVPGAVVTVKGTNKGTQTDTDGKYAISASEGDTLHFSYIGYKGEDVLVGATHSINIALESTESSLKEVVVTALGISREKRSLGYSVQELKSRDITEARETNLVNALSGKIAGVN
ncbi:MAG TPA: carboxypeptidase-like regulatory domain-containing protein, partial [Chitinophaga sp.]